MPIDVALESVSRETSWHFINLRKKKSVIVVPSYVLLVGKDFSNLTDFLSW